MSAPLHYVRMYYKNHEEVLETGLWYFRVAAGLTVNTRTVRELAETVGDSLNALPPILGTDFVAYGIEVNVPQQDNLAGPFSYMYNRVQKVALGSASYGDAYTYNIALEGLNAAGELVTGGMRIAGVEEGTVDCNVLDSTRAGLVTTVLNNIFPQQITLSGGETYIRAIRSKVGTVDEDVVTATQLNCSNRIGIRSDRVLNRFARARQTTGDPGVPT